MYDCMAVNGSIPEAYFPDKNCSEMAMLPRNSSNGNIANIYKADEISY